MIFEGLSGIPEDGFLRVFMDIQGWFLKDFKEDPRMVLGGFNQYPKMVFGGFDWEYLLGFRNYLRDICEVYADTQWLTKLSDRLRKL